MRLGRCSSASRFACQSSYAARAIAQAAGPSSPHTPDHVRLLERREEGLKRGHVPGCGLMLIAAADVQMRGILGVDPRVRAEPRELGGRRILLVSLRRRPPGREAL